MKTITTNQTQHISGGCQVAIDRYEGKTELYSLAGFAIGGSAGYVFSEALPLPARALAVLGGSFVGSEAGYVTGAIAYWTDRAIYKTVDAYLKPTL